MTGWNVEWARDMILNGGRFGPKRVMEQVYRHNCDVARQFAQVLDEPEFKGKFRAVAFAILEGRGSARRPVEDNGKFALFYETFVKRA